MHTLSHTYACMHAHTHTHACAQACTHTHTHTHTMYALIPTPTHTHTHNFSAQYCRYKLWWTQDHHNMPYWQPLLVEASQLVWICVCVFNVKSVPVPLTTFCCCCFCSVGTNCTLVQPNSEMPQIKAVSFLKNQLLEREPLIALASTMVSKLKLQLLQKSFFFFWQEYCPIGISAMGN